MIRVKYLQEMPYNAGVAIKQTLLDDEIVSLSIITLIKKSLAENKKHLKFIVSQIIPYIHLLFKNYHHNQK